MTKQIAFFFTTTFYQLKAYKQHSKAHEKKRPLVKKWWPSVSGTATSTTAGCEVPTPVLTASVKKLLLRLPSAGEGSGGGNNFSELGSSIPGSSSTEATAEMQGLSLIDYQSLLASVRKLKFQCADCSSSPPEVREKLDLGFHSATAQLFEEHDAACVMRAGE